MAAGLLTRGRRSKAATLTGASASDFESLWPFRGKADDDHCPSDRQARTDEIAGASNIQPYGSQVSSEQTRWAEINQRLEEIARSRAVDDDSGRDTERVH